MVHPVFLQGESDFTMNRRASVQESVTEMQHMVGMNTPMGVQNLPQVSLVA